ncbi:MAG: 16S rRNA (adenine(1518)-N(6)/adenine(1519)-N(6))-dimethyltransferase RsmA [Candidatus Dojkabacteria bacterium]|nr:MAG: 16S rRNA (adenine(1518)-N(6)/adenine(1519)-N(6))-dimethyltransferase RsmA [Candidatus Dojkabacteria bacterium]
MHNFKKQFGQNFLRNTSFVIDLLTASGISKDDHVLEIGPGDGSVTEYICESAASITAVEIDAELIDSLNSRFSAYPNFKLINQDILSFNESDNFANKDYIVVGSLPYNISKNIIRKFLTSKNPPKRMAVIMQKEVAEDYTANTPRSSFLSNFASLYSEPKYICTIPKEAFEPTPKVDGAIVLFEITQPRFNNPEKLLSFIKIGFSSPRKKLSSNLANVGLDKNSIETELAKLGYSKTARASEITLDSWHILAKTYGKN